MVEARRVELLSEKPSTQLSPGAAYDQISLPCKLTGKLAGSVASLFMVWAKLTIRTFTTN